MRAFLIAAAIAAAGPAFADAIARTGSDWVRLTLQPCANAAAAAVRAEGKDPLEFRAAVAHIGEHDFTACWHPVSGGAGLIFSDGDTGYVPVGDLHPAPEA